MQTGCSLVLLQQSVTAHGQFCDCSEPQYSLYVAQDATILLVDCSTSSCHMQCCLLRLCLPLVHLCPLTVIIMYT